MLMCDDNMNIAIYKLRYPSRGARWKKNLT
jgi:hypothetical protein